MKKNAKYMIVYDSLYKQIKNGSYPVGYKLPSEEKLREIYSVSRVTVRLAIDMLKDDGFIKSKQGQGNYVIKSTEDYKQGIEVLGNPFYKSIIQEIDNVDLVINTDLAFERDRELFKNDVSVVIRADRWYEFENKNYGYCDTTISPSTIEELQINLANNDEVKDFLENKIYLLTNYSETEIFYVHMKKQHLNRVIENKMKNDYVMILESIHNQKGDIIAINKFYIPLTLCRIKLNSHL